MLKAVTHLARFLCDSDWLLIVFYSHTFQKTFSDLVYFPTNLLLAASNCLQTRQANQKLVKLVKKNTKTVKNTKYNKGYPRLVQTSRCHSSTRRKPPCTDETVKSSSPQDMIHRYNCPLLLQILLLFFANNISNVQACTSTSECATGEFCDVGTCYDCPAGMELLAASLTNTALTGKNKCTTCEAGKTSTAGSTECTDCSLGMYSISTTNSANTYSLDARETCKKCVVGKQFASKSTACAICAAGTYQNQNDQAPAVCSNCPTGKYLLDTATDAALHDALLDCLFCLVGTEFVDKTTSCTICDAGKYQSSNSQGNPAAQCTFCSASTYYVDKVSSCPTCPTGKYQEQASYTTASVSCKFCIKGMEFNGKDNVCKICLKGKYQSQEDTQGVTCDMCPAGQYITDDATSAALHEACTNCPVGKAVTSTGSSSITFCQYCDAGKKNKGDFSQCQVCSPGEFNPVSGSLSGIGICSVCPGGWYNSNDDSDANTHKVCDYCLAGKYLISTSNKLGHDNINDCTACPAGFFSDTSQRTDGAGAVECSICPSGTFATANAYPCTVCPAGKHIEDDGTDQSKHDAAAKCVACEIGKYLTDAGGSYTAAKAAAHNDPSNCLNCLVGTYNDATGAASCTSCPRGSFVDAVGQDALSDCALCGVGKYQNVVGQSSCISCPSGYMHRSSDPNLDSSGSSVCIICPYGKHGINDRSDCTNCLATKHQDQTGQSSCKNCPQGWVQTVAGNKECLACGFGKVESSNDRLNCIECGSAKHQDQTGQTACKTCAAGKWNIEDNQQDCKLCPTGFIGVADRKSCTICLATTFQNALGATACKTCPNGYIQDGASAPSLFAKPASCYQCPNGWKEAGTLLSCSECPNALYQNEAAQRTCKNWSVYLIPCRELLIFFAV